MSTLAHVGHWWFYPLYGIPVLIVLASALGATIRDRRERRGSSGE